MKLIKKLWHKFVKWFNEGSEAYEYDPYAEDYDPYWERR